MYLIFCFTYVLDDKTNKNLILSDDVISNNEKVKGSSVTVDIPSVISRDIDDVKHKKSKIP